MANSIVIRTPEYRMQYELMSEEEMHQALINHINERLNTLYDHHVYMTGVYKFYYVQRYNTFEISPRRSP